MEITLQFNYQLLFCRVIDVGSEWRTFSNEKSGVDPSRVGGPENPLLGGSDLTTIIGPGRGNVYNVLFTIFVNSHFATVQLVGKHQVLFFYILL